MTTSYKDEVSILLALKKHDFIPLQEFTFYNHTMWKIILLLFTFWIFGNEYCETDC